VVGPPVNPYVVVELSVMRGISKPLFVKSISSPASPLGGAPVELIPTFWDFKIKTKKTKISFRFVFIQQI
jgi:hypothetical protein